MVIFVDMDGVLCDLHTPLLKLYNNEYNDNLTIDDITQWDMTKIVKKKCGSRLLRFLDTPNFFRDLVPLEGAIEGVHKLIETGHDVYIATAATSHPNSVIGKIGWLNEHLPVMMKHPRKVVFTHHKHLLRGDVLFDDSPKNLETFDGISVAMDMPYNNDKKWTEENHICRVYSWEHFMNMIYLFDWASKRNITEPFKLLKGTN